MFNIFEALEARASKIANSKDEFSTKRNNALKEIAEADKAAAKAIAAADADKYAEAEGTIARLKLVIEGIDKITANLDQRLTFDEGAVMWSEYMKTYNPQMQKKLDEYAVLKAKLYEKYIECARYQNEALRVRATLSDSMEPSTRYFIDNTAGFEDMNCIESKNVIPFLKDDKHQHSINWGALDTCTVSRVYAPEL